MISDERKKQIVKLFIVILVLILLIRFVSFVYARYESNGLSSAEVDVAFFIFNEDFQSMTLNLDELFPATTVHTYSFSVSNVQGTKRADVDIAYTIKIRTTENLSLRYALYMNETYNSGSNILINNGLQRDDHFDTSSSSTAYFRYFEAPEEIMRFNQNVTNVYQLTVTFPSAYSDIKYQDIIEVIEISVEARQLTDND